MNKKITGKIEKLVKEQAKDLNINKVSVALSGGADSVATLYSIIATGLDIIALHCNFHLRGKESIRDQEFVESFCNNFNIPLLIKHFDVEEYIKTHKGNSIEMACRNLRYEWFLSEFNNRGLDRIALGHNLNDNIETFFLNLTRGAGIRGLKGMEADTGRLWRPLLSFTREDILTYLEENNLSYVTDSSNLQSDYRRNYLRNDILPMFRSKWPGFEKSLSSSLQHLSDENRIIESALRQALPEDGQPLKTETILNFPAPVLLIKRYIDKAGPFTTTPYEVYEAIKACKPHIPVWNLRFGKVFLKKGKLFVEISHSECSS